MTTCELIRKSLSLNLCLHLHFHGRGSFSEMGVGLDMGCVLRHIFSCAQRGAKRSEAQEGHTGTGAVRLYLTEFITCLFILTVLSFREGSFVSHGQSLSAE